MTFSFCRDLVLLSVLVVSPLLAQEEGAVVFSVDPSNPPDNWYIWNLEAKNESWSNSSIIERPTSWLQSNGTQPISRPILEKNPDGPITLAFLQPVDGKYCYSQLKVDFTPLTLGGLYVESGALGTTSKNDNPSLSSFGIVNVLGTGETKENIVRYLNIWNGSSANNEAVLFELHESFTLGGSSPDATSNATFAFTNINVYSNWNIQVDSGKTLSLYGPLAGGVIGGETKTITLSKGGTLLLNDSSPFLKANWRLEDNSTIQFNASYAKLTSTNLLGSGSISVASTGGSLKIAGDKAINLSNNISIEQGGSFTTIEQVRSASGNVANPDDYFYNLIVYVNMSGNISGEGDWVRASALGKSSTNESWIFTGDNINFHGNWYTNADVNYYKEASGYVGDKTYGYTPMMFGNGSRFMGTDFHSIAGWGSIIGNGTDNVDRNGAVVGFNYGNDVIIYNNLEQYLKIRHLSDQVLELAGSNNYIFGTYVEAGGTLRFTQASNLGDPTGKVYGRNYAAGAAVVLNNNSTIEFAALQTEIDQGTMKEKVLTNALFNDSGDWGIKVTHEGVSLSWDLSQSGLYDKSRSPSLPVAGTRSGKFTKSGAGTLNITAGSLLTSTNSIYIEEGILAFSGTGNWGTVDKIVMNAGTTLRSEAEMVLGTGMKLTTDIDAADYDENGYNTSYLDGSLRMNGGILDFVMSDISTRDNVAGLEPDVGPTFNVFKLSGNFSIGADGGVFNFSFYDGMSLWKSGYYLLFTAGNDLTSISADDWAKITFSGLPEMSRQIYKLMVGGTQWTDSEGVVQTVDGTNNQAYLYATPEMANLTWSLATGGIWEVKHGENDWIGHLTDNRFYNGDMVNFGDYNDIVADRTITLNSNVNSSRITFGGDSHYTIDSTKDGDGNNLYGIYGQGIIEKAGAGTLDILISNQFSGGTFIHDGVVNARASYSFGTGRIVIDGGVLNAEAYDALGTGELVMKGGVLDIKEMNPSQGDSRITGGTIYARAAMSLGNTGRFDMSGGDLYALAGNAMGNNAITLTGGTIHAFAGNALGTSSIIVSDNGTIRTEAGNYDSCLGSGKIVLREGGTLELRNSSALNSLSQLFLDGGKLYVEGVVDASSFTNIKLANAKLTTIDVAGTDSKLILGGGLGIEQTAHILKQGSGEFEGKLIGNFLATIEIAGGKARMVQKKDATGAYTSYYFGGVILGSGIMEFSGGSISARYADLSAFEGTLLVNLDANDQTFYMMPLVQNNDALIGSGYDVEAARGRIYLADSGGLNYIYWGNLYSGAGADAEGVTIGGGRDVLTTSLTSMPEIVISQTRNDLFKGKFVNGGNDGLLTTSVTKQGGATLVLSNDSTSTGTLRVEDGILQLGNGGTTGYWQGAIVNNAKLAFNYGNVDKTYDQAISGTGSIDVTSGGTVTFTNENTYTGGTNINNGSVALRNNGTLGSGTVTMSGTSRLDAGNTNGLQDRNIVVADNSSATISNARLGSGGRVSSAAAEGSQAAVSILGGELSGIVLNTVNGKATLSGNLAGASVGLSGQGSSPVLQNTHFDVGTSGTASNGTSYVDSGFAVSYAASSIVGTDAGKEIVDAKLVLGTGGIYDLSGMNALTINLDESGIAALGNANNLTIYLFGKDADMSKVLNGDNVGGLSNILLNNVMKENGWLVSDRSVTGDTAWWNSGELALEKGSIPESSTAGFLLAGAFLMMSSRRKRR